MGGSFGGFAGRDVPCRVLEGVLGEGSVPEEDSAGDEGHEEPLVGVHRYRVGPLDTRQDPRILPTQAGGSAVGRIHMEPEAGLLGQIGQLREGVDGPGCGGSGDSDDGERLQPLHAGPLPSFPA